MKEFDENEITCELYARLLWSTINQKHLITPSLEPLLYDYLSDLTLNEGCHLIGGKVFSDHVQLVVKFTPYTIISDLITNLKVASALWIRTNFPEIDNFQWQRSDFGFGTGYGEVGSSIEQINRGKSFKEEVHALFHQNEMEYDAAEILE